MRGFDSLEEGLLALRPSMDSAARHACIEKLVDQVGLRRDALDRYPHEFSGGQRQRVQRELGVSYLFITHNIGVVEYVADHVAVMQNGRIGEMGVADAVLRHPRSTYTRTLLAAVPRIQYA